MIFFNKKKTRLRELIPSNFVDIHSHLIPGIDDGAKTIDDSIKLIVALEKIGFKKFITTPHIIENLWNNTPEIIFSGEKIVQAKLIENSIPVSIKASAEYMMDSYFSDLIATKNIIPLKDFYVLVEMSYLNPPLQLFDIIFDIQNAGYKPVLAHPERYIFYHNNLAIYSKLKNSGCLFQLNLLSITGYYGEGVTKIAQKLLSLGLIDFVGSDVHHLNHVQSFENKIILKDEVPLKEAINNNQLFSF